jgi:hypothetical protein
MKEYLQQMDKSLANKRVQPMPDSLSLLQHRRKLQVPGREQLATF